MMYVGCIYPIDGNWMTTVIVANRHFDQISSLNNQLVQDIHCNLCVLLYCSIHDINVLLRIIKMTLKTNTGKYLKYFTYPEESANQTPRKATCLNLSLRDQPIRSD